ncbi:MAG: universal stress protein [Deltaproteobacteria bacterium]|nr:MAG: universal stress protein [Deltaproteobacteria bacterium]
MSVERILVAVDLRGATTEIVKASLALAAPLGAEIVLFTVVSVAAGVNPFAESAEGRTNEQVLDADAFVDLEPYVALIEREGVRVTRDIGHGEPSVGIASAIERHRPDLVVVGTHARTGLARLLLGSVAEAVLRSSPVPVMVVRSPATGLDPGE